MIYLKTLMREMLIASYAIALLCYTFYMYEYLGPFKCFQAAVR